MVMDTWGQCTHMLRRITMPTSNGVFVIMLEVTMDITDNRTNSLILPKFGNIYNTIIPNCYSLLLFIVTQISEIATTARGNK